MHEHLKKASELNIYNYFSFVYFSRKKKNVENETSGIWKHLNISVTMNVCNNIVIQL